MTHNIDFRLQGRGHVSLGHVKQAPWSGLKNLKTMALMAHIQHDVLEIIISTVFSVLNIS